MNPTATRVALWALTMAVAAAVGEMGRGGCPASTSAQHLVNAPRDCPMVAQCQATLCSCMGATLNRTSMTCWGGTASCESQGMCVGSAVECFLAAAGNASDAMSSDKCMSWGSSIAGGPLNSSVRHESCTNFACVELMNAYPKCNASSMKYADMCRMAVVNGSAPTPSIVLATRRVAEPNVFLSSQDVRLSLRLRGSGRYTVTWLVNGAVVTGKNHRTIVLTEANLNVTTNLSMPMPNHVEARAKAEGEETEVAVETTLFMLGPQKITLTSIKNLDNVSQPAIALNDTLQLEVASSAVTSTIFELRSSVVVGYVETFGENMSYLPLGKGMNSTFDVVAPLTRRLNGTANVTFFAALLLNGVVSATSTMQYPVTLPAVGKLVDTELEALDNASSAADNVKVTASLSTLLGHISNKTEKDKISKAIVSGLRKSLKADSELSTTEQQQMLAALRASLQSGDRKTLSGDANSIVGLLMSNPNFATDQAESVLEVLAISDDNGTEMAAQTRTLAEKVMAKLEVGSKKEFSYGGVTVAAGRTFLTELSNSTVSAGGTSVTLPAGVFAGRSDDVVGWSATTGAAPAANGQETLGSEPVSLSLSFPVSGLAAEDRIKFQIPKKAGASKLKCKFYDVSQWSTSGLETSGETPTTLVCLTNHLTTFAGFSASTTDSPASSTVLSLTAVVVVAVLQAWMHLAH